MGYCSAPKTHYTIQVYCVVVPGRQGVYPVSRSFWPHLPWNFSDREYILLSTSCCLTFTQYAFWKVLANTQPDSYIRGHTSLVK